MTDVIVERRPDHERARLDVEAKAQWKWGSHFVTRIGLERFVGHGSISVSIYGQNQSGFRSRLCDAEVLAFDSARIARPFAVFFDADGEFSRARMDFLGIFLRFRRDEGFGIDVEFFRTLRQQP